MNHVKKPDWLKINIGANARYTETKHIVDSHKLHTICSSGRCPNMGECWGKGTATFMIGGEICTRSCKFCNTQTGRPLPLDPEEPTHVAESIQLMKLSHAVITSVDRDDLDDLGAAHWAKTISEIKRLNPETTTEVLIPDFQGKSELIQLVIDYITPDQFKQYRTIGLKKGFREVESAPLVRSSYHAEKHIKFKG